MPLRNTLVRLALSLAALILCPQPADAQQPPPSAWSLGGTIGAGYVGGDGGSVMRSPRLIAVSIERRIGDSPWWVGAEGFDLRARPTAAGMDTIRAHASAIYTNDERDAHYNTRVLWGLVRYEAPAHGALVPYALAGLGWSGTIGFVCNSSDCAAGDVKDGDNHRRTMMIGAGTALRFGDMSPRLAGIPAMLHGEVRLMDVSTRHGEMFVTPVLIGVSIWTP